MIRSIVLASILLGFSVPAVQGRQSLEFDLSRLSERSRDAYAKLQSAIMFRIGPVGIAGETSPEEVALQNLLYDGESTEALRSLCRTASTAGTLYALIGLRIRDIKAFEQELQLYRDRSEASEKRLPPVHSEQIESRLPSLPSIEAGPGIVLTQSGCLIMPEQKESLLRKIESGVYGGGSGMITIRELSPPK